MRADRLRRLYLDYFVERGHTLIPSASLVPNDPTLLFTSAGMVQFKDIFWGRIDPPYPKATSCQKCFRATDIENVGRTAFHHTFFEMLGNFSFADYFKQGVIELAWAFVTEELSIPKERLWVSVYEDDEDAAAIWRDVAGLPAERIVRLGKAHNWWGPVGDAGPCGPDSELFVDAGPDKACGPECRGPACECDRFSEIWNLVFMEYDAREDGSLVPLARQQVDTGMGLERTAAVLQGVETDFETDLFAPIVEAIAAAAAEPIPAGHRFHRDLIADHVRGAVLLVADGVMPSNDKQGYVLRSILRRAVRAADRLALPPGSLAGLVDPVVASLSDAYPEVVAGRALAEKVIGNEETTFRRTLDSGERRLAEILDRLEEDGERILPGELAFELYDTHGFPLGMTAPIAAERGIAVDEAGFEAAMTEQRVRSRVTVSLKAEPTLIPAGRAPTVFLGYETTTAESTLENALPSDGVPSRLVFPESPFYPEGGGQVADTGTIEKLSGERTGHARVTGVTRNAKGVVLHEVEILDGAFEIGDRCRLTVDAVRRARIARNHTATHLLHEALHRTLGEHAIQAGSLVTPEELRFDFTHFERMTGEETARVEDIANEVVLSDLEVETGEMPLAEAKASGAAAHFDEEYRDKDEVRVVSVGDFSRELCAGTHVRRSGEIGLIRIVSEESIASGVRRIRAVTGDGVLARLRAAEGVVSRLRSELGDDLLQGVDRLREDVRDLRNRLDEVAVGDLDQRSEALLADAERFGEVSLVHARVDLEAERLKGLADRLEAAARPAVVLLGGASSGRAVVVCKRSPGIEGVNAGTIVRAAASSVGGGGGGSRSFGQGGGRDVDALDGALADGAAAIRAGLTEGSG